jgi:hypothetical protein
MKYITRVKFIDELGESITLTVDGHYKTRAEVRREIEKTHKVEVIYAVEEFGIDEEPGDDSTNPDLQLP